MSIDEIRAARVALACLMEPGSADVHRLIAENGPVGGSFVGSLVSAGLEGPGFGFFFSIWSSS